jgi:hypothetical protein
MPTLHVLNGDGTAYSFRQTDLPGEVLVWREMLCVERIPSTDDFDTFWSQRADFLVEYEGFDRAEYERLSEVQRLQDFRRYDEITLWFEFDLFCQVNLLYLLQFFAGQRLGSTRLTLVSPGTFPGRPDFKGMGELTAVELATLWPERLQLTEFDLRVGRLAWQAYREGPPAVRAFLAAEEFGQLVHLKTALEAHLSRFPAAADGLGSIERFWLQNLRAGATEPVPVMHQFWNEHPEFGLGDFQLLQTLDELQQAGLVRQHGTLALTERGHDVLAGTRTYQTFATRPRFLGGVERFSA